ncbi:hypothetical protein Ait01nite_025320 [Actinoplanes italicus]|uniref:Uncharacterized protein n=1 Tax=Actinoplanes italicus TaxID=113567 RepID=A0A2T0KFE3_9ACTN|nr:DUF6461 domain-containing protein [Actinoplanes italicus]PRX22097.1 hypothetical protein CLV67_105274 [Actinoplanes italicus]GIE29487.1 hypothetical protein Ait01nite_025320 [Actinoplanes italicus]
MTGWDGVPLWGGGGEAQARACLTAGADPCLLVHGYTTPLHAGAEHWSPELMRAMAAAAGDVDVLVGGRSPLWVAVDSGRYDNARVLVAAGADPWRPMMAGWSPGRLSLAGPEPGLFGAVPPGVELTAEERAAAELAADLAVTLRVEYYDGTGLLAVAGIDAAEAIRRLGGTAMSEDELLAHYDVEVDEDWEPGVDEDDWKWLFDVDDLLLVGLTDVEGGCVVTQPWGYQPQTPVVGRLLSAGTAAYGLYANPKSGNQGSVYRDGKVIKWDLHPGGEAWDSDGGELVLLSHLYRHRAPAFACGFAGLRPADARCITGPADQWVLLPDRNYWER